MKCAPNEDKGCRETCTVHPVQGSAQNLIPLQYQPSPSIRRTSVVCSMMMVQAAAQVEDMILEVSLVMKCCCLYSVGSVEWTGQVIL